ncbi:hypothetical protein OEZ86_007857 [Tetradesmus obliquus]|uniref:ER membrane protein complex subunit 4 n=2 Tax=Tetradesmus obliquus TaxID=3088 RepID=A0A383VZE2_TETOB|nr:hypothetical protein OEZ85_013063 [Tetradesmus obliquus]WIA36565.1 hypothetical protein OEZ86_007857 [Tetradesmus obliquus]|eukprot:jgi/Sobl393_1/12047/SZX70815.1
MAEQKPWKMDFDSVEGLKHHNKLDPPGFDSVTARDWVAGTSTLGKRRDPQLIEKKQAALWQLASAPFRQVGFMCFMMWMMGNGIQIFSILMTLSGLATPVMAIIKSKEVFPADPEKKLDTLTPRLLYCVINAGQFVFALHKLNAMGLLPTHPSDWLSAIAVPASLEHSYGAL